MSTDRTAPGYVPRLLSAAAFLTNRATEESLVELRLTHERTVILRLLSESSATEDQLCVSSGLASACVRDCVLALQHCGYIASAPGAAWMITPAGATISVTADHTEARLMSLVDNDVESLRRELHALITALTPPR
ncbi:hypothetical protein MUG94_16470 [Arthrobacter gengyunqii]|uniref:Uncharacterized protein n=1 Tax=Arthrobacter gengyunqii TaxID=2886940 RepID=A0A9X1S719_9MICC|nr:hypothetical protein [Arthrobacter gengyunqii]MCC3268709.1 hypothetical protein [Arthrobacter gengyunqii]UOY96094.1 hypothetical protein MUG94_16470 [Arthrobacter gengyunqii]